MRLNYFLGDGNATATDFSGNIILKTDSIESSSGYGVKTSGTVTFAPYTANTTIGFSGGAGNLAITQAIMDSVDAPNVVIGSLTGTGLLTTGDFNWEHTLNHLTLEEGGSTGAVTIGGNITKGVDDGSVANSADGTLTVIAGSNIVQNSGKAIASSGSYGKLDVLYDSDYAGAGGAISISGNITSNGGNIILGGGNGTISAGSGYAVGDAASQYGIYLNNATVDADTGNIVANGQGYSNASSYFLNGIYVNGASAAFQTSSGNITLHGISGSGTFSGAGPYYFGNEGVMLYNGGQVTSTTGDINIIGTGNGNSADNVGVYLIDGEIRSTSGSIAIAGNVATNNGWALTGVTLKTGSQIITASGVINIMGTAGHGSSNDNGIVIATGSSISSTSSGTITLTGISDSTGYGILFKDGPGNSVGSGSDTGTITLNADSLSLSGLSIQTTGNLQIKPYTSGTTIGVGSGTGNLSIDDTALGTFTYGSLTIGGTNAGAMDIDSGYAFTAPVTFQTGSGADITLDGALASSATGTAVTLAAGHDFVNHAGADAITLSGTGSPRWLIYSTAPKSDTTDGLSSDFHRYSCTYGGACPDFSSESGNGFLYSYRPVLTVVPNEIALNEGDEAPDLTKYGYTVTGYLNGTDKAIDTIHGLLAGSTTYTQGSTAGRYAINYYNGLLGDTLGYRFAYANNPNAITVHGNGITIPVTPPHDSTPTPPEITPTVPSLLHTYSTVALAATVRARMNQLPFPPMHLPEAHPSDHPLIVIDPSLADLLHLDDDRQITWMQVSDDGSLPGDRPARRSKTRAGHAGSRIGR